MKIAVTGTRGFPKIQGGVENHCEHLYTELARIGYEIIVFTRKPYVTYSERNYKNISLIPVSCPRHKYLETVIHTFKSVIKASRLNTDILHIHSIGASFFAPLARLLRMKVVVTHHGQDYKREKWNALAKFILKICEIVGMKFANEVIVITNEISEHVKNVFDRDSTIIPNGVRIPLREELDGKKILNRYKLQAGKYVLNVGRFVPEKAIDVLIDAFGKADTKDWKLVIVGSADHKDSYSAKVEKKAQQYSNIILTGFLTGEALYGLYKHAGLFVLPSYYEGLPIVLLEALSYGLSCIASNIPGNRNLSLNEDRYFKPGSIDNLQTKIEDLIEKPWTEEDRKRQIDYINQYFNWQGIAQRTFDVYDKVLKESYQGSLAVSFQTDSKIKIAVIGTRGFPDIQGGVETHCQNLYPHLVERGCEVIVITRKPYISSLMTSYKGVKFLHVNCPQNKYTEAFIHTLKALWIVKELNPDILHIHAIGPSLFSPVAAAYGMKVLVTHHGENYRHMKWGIIAKQVLRLCESIGMNYSDSVISISEEIARSVKRKFKKDSYVIPNGVAFPSYSVDNQEILEKLGLRRGNYILNVGRFVPEKGIDVLIKSFVKAKTKDWKLVIVGRADHVDGYSEKIGTIAHESENIILAGFQTGQPLYQLYSSAGLFVLPSHYEGLPIVLLEAMSYGLSCIASDIPGNRNLPLSDERYFRPGDVEMLSGKIEEFIDKPWWDEDRAKLRAIVKSEYNWETIADDTMNVYNKLLSRTVLSSA